MGNMKVPNFENVECAIGRAKGTFRDLNHLQVALQYVLTHHAKGSRKLTSQPEEPFAFLQFLTDQLESLLNDLDCYLGQVEISLDQEIQIASDQSQELPF
jgi:hypothetical protein